jgi:8-oxo-dGTP pyrophosphatase MutT (NUDIX family)
LNDSKQEAAETQSGIANLLRLALSPKAWQEAARRLRQRVTRSVGLGVRGIVLDKEGRVFLVRHTYRKGWYFPGGGVEPGETIAEALARELIEEARISLDAAALLHGVFLQKRRWHSDHVACFLVRDFHQTGTRQPDWEIAETGFFSPAALPEDTTRATRTRLNELLNKQPPSPFW